MIVGIGHDIVEMDRIGRILDGSAGERFMRRVLTDAEYEAARTKGRLAEFVAGRFAAKESVVKALGCGIGALVGFRDMEILPDQAGKPLCTLSAAARCRLVESGPGYVLPAIHVTITHERALASAFAVAERLPSIP